MSGGIAEEVAAVRQELAGATAEIGRVLEYLEGNDRRGGASIGDLVQAAARANDLRELEALERTIARLGEEVASPKLREARDAEILRLEQLGAAIRRRLWPPPPEKPEESPPDA